MDTEKHLALAHDTEKAFSATTRGCLVGLFAAAIVLGIRTEPPIINGPVEPSSCCDDAAASGSENDSSRAVVAASSHSDRPVAADVVAGYVGGIAARVRTATGSPVPGNLFVLMATAGSDAHARLYDKTPYTHDYGVHADVVKSNVTAVETVEGITGEDLDPVDLTTAPGGGPSGGLIYAITYLNIISNGAFTGDVRVAATGRLSSHGYVHPINAIDEKIAAAHLAGADVLFTPSTPTNENIDEYGARLVGELFRARNTGAALAEERRLDNYRDWGADHPNGMDVVGIRHIADVAAYLCGTGSNYACGIVDILGDDVVGGATIAIANVDGDVSEDRALLVGRGRAR